jgi:predicted metal-dependent phosphoesterase TrpH
VAVGVEAAGAQADLARLIDYVEVHNGRVRDTHANARATEFAQRFGVPGVAASDAHSESEVGHCAIVLDLPIGTATAMHAALAGPRRLVVRERPAVDSTLRGRLARRLRG